MPHRYFTRELADGRAALTGSDAHHLADVMRARIGEEVVLCGPDGLEYLGTVTAIEPGRVEFSVTDGTTSKAEPDCAVTLFAGYPKAGKLEEVIRHSVELGVTEVVPFFSRYCVATPKKEDIKNERYNRIAAEAAKQAGRAMLPHVALPLNDFAAVCKAFADFDVVLFFYEGGGAPLREVLHPGQYKRVAIVTGSEGGFSVEEAEAAKAAGCNKVALGHHFDDVVETYMLSLFYEGRISCFQPVTYLDRADITLIRPLLYVPEYFVRSFAKRHELPIVHNPCPADGNTKRQEIKELLKNLEKTMPGLRERIFGAMQRYPLDGWAPDRTRKPKKPREKK